MTFGMLSLSSSAGMVTSVASIDHLKYCSGLERGSERGSECDRVRTWYRLIRDWTIDALTAHAKLNIKLKNQHKCEEVGADAGTGGGGICEEAELCEPAWSA